MLYLAPSPRDTHTSWLVLISWDRAEQLSPSTRDSYQEPPLSGVNSDSPTDLSTNLLPRAAFTDRPGLKGSWGWSSADSALSCMDFPGRVSSYFLSGWLTATRQCLRSLATHTADWPPCSPSLCETPTPPQINLNPCI